MMSLFKLINSVNGTDFFPCSYIKGRITSFYWLGDLEIYMAYKKKRRDWERMKKIEKRKKRSIGHTFFFGPRSSHRVITRDEGHIWVICIQLDHPYRNSNLLSSEKARYHGLSASPSLHSFSLFISSPCEPSDQLLALPHHIA